jgi:hypothetical protein
MTSYDSSARRALTNWLSTNTPNVVSADFLVHRGHGRVGRERDDGPRRPFDGCAHRTGNLREGAATYPLRPGVFRIGVNTSGKLAAALAASTAGSCRLPSRKFRRSERAASSRGVLCAERGELREELGQSCVFEETPRIGAETLVSRLTLPPKAIPVLHQQRFQIADGELEGLDGVDPEDRPDRLVAKADELHRTVGVLIHLAGRADAELNGRTRLPAQPESARRDDSPKWNGSGKRRPFHAGQVRRRARLPQREPVAGEALSTFSVTRSVRTSR